MANGPSQLIRTLVAAVRDQGWWVLVVMSLIGAGLWGFAEIADEIEDGEAHEFDRAVMLAMQGGPEWLDLVARDITSLGGAAVLVLLTVAALGYLLLVRKWSAAIFVAISIVGGTLISTALKHIFDRPRPDLVPHGSIVSSSSFPSGHSMTAAVVYLTLAAVLMRVQTRRRLQLYVLTLALLITVAVGISRVYLGVHWPSDVLAGWTAGAAWAVLCWSVALWMQKKGEVEKGPDA